MATIVITADTTQIEGAIQRVERRLQDLGRTTGLTNVKLVK